MKKRYQGIRIIIGMCAALGWWGLLYPELTLTPDTVRVISEGMAGERLDVTGDWKFDSTLFEELLTAGEGEIRFRSRLLTELSALVEAVQNAE